MKKKMKIQNLDSQTGNLYKEDAGLSIHLVKLPGVPKNEGPFYQ
jgi:hypothetical protein